MSPSSIDARMQLTALLIRTGDGDEQAFGELYSRTVAKLFGICLRICGEREAAEDVLHEVYLIVWRRAGAYDPGRAGPITWLATIARNRSIDWRRASSRRTTVPVDDLPLPDSRPLALDDLLVVEESRRLAECLGELEERAGEAIRMAFFGGVTYAELAEARAVPLNTMKSWIRRGLIRLRECLNRGG